MSSKQAYKLCERCVMDTSDPEISFDADGVCNHCHRFDEDAGKIWFPNEVGKEHLNALIEGVKHKNRHREYDCIMGISGGVDSSYLALILKEYGLRVLAVHVDAGWNSELAVSNIEAVLKHCGYDLHTHVVDWESIRRLQLAYLRSGIANQDVPQDHVFFAVLYKVAVRMRCNTFMSGGNVATEFVFPESWHGDAMDRINLMDIYKKFGNGPLGNYETIGFWDWNMLFRARGMHQIRPLNYMPYSVKEAIPKLEAVGWRNYGRKHGESRFTKFFQNYLLPARYGYDKRRPHYSSRVLSGDLTREEALALLEQPLYEADELESDKVFFCKKLQITEDELQGIIDAPHRHYTEFRNWDRRRALLRSLLSRVKGLIRYRTPILPNVERSSQ